jgi:hypothetical protein
VVTKEAVAVPSRLTHLYNRVSELDALGSQVWDLARDIANGKPVKQELAMRGEEWYRGARSFLEMHEFSGLSAFDLCYESYFVQNGETKRALWDIGSFIHFPLDNQMHYQTMLSGFANSLGKARALLHGCLAELESREIPMRTELSFTVAADEFETASALLSTSKDEPIVRAAGVIARVALERHLLTVAESRRISIERHPPHKAKQDTADIMNTLQKHGVITAIQKSDLETQFRIGNNCAHPKEVVRIDDVQNMIRRSREIAAAVL